MAVILVNLSYVTILICCVYRLMASLFVDQINLFLNEAVRSPGTTASVSRILPPKIALIMIACLRVSNPVPVNYFSLIISQNGSHFHITFNNT